MTPSTYEAPYRRTAFALTAICILVAALPVSIVAAIRFIGDGNTSLSVILYSMGVIFVLVIVVAILSFRVHCWTIEDAGIRIEERPKIPFMGFGRRAFVAFPDVAALRNVESGLDFLIEIATRDGRTFRLMQRQQQQATGIGSRDVQGLKAFADEIARAAAGAGAVPSIAEGLSFWNRPFGIGVIAVMLAFSLAFAGAAGCALREGDLTVRPRSGEMLAIALLLPVGAAYLLYKSLRRRRQVLGTRPVVLPDAS